MERLFEGLALRGVGLALISVLGAVGCSDRGSDSGGLDLEAPSESTDEEPPINTGGGDAPTPTVPATYGGTYIDPEVLAEAGYSSGDGDYWVELPSEELDMTLVPAELSQLLSDEDRGAIEKLEFAPMVPTLLPQWTTLAEDVLLLTYIPPLAPERRSMQLQWEAYTPESPHDTLTPAARLVLEANVFQREGFESAPLEDDETVLITTIEGATGRTYLALLGYSGPEGEFIPVCEEDSPSLDEPLQSVVRLEWREAHPTDDGKIVTYALEMTPSFACNTLSGGEVGDVLAIAETLAPLEA